MERKMQIDELRIKTVINEALQSKVNKTFLFSENITPPEKPYIEILTEHGNKIGDQNFAVNALFLTTAFVFGEKTENLFKRITNSEKLENFAWLFDPEIALKRSDDEVESGLLEFFKPAGYSSNVIPQWKHNLSILKEKYSNNIRNLFTENDNDAQKIIKSLFVRNRAKSNEKDNAFRRYGPKLSHLALQWITQYKLHEIKNIETSGLPIDFQVARIFIQTKGLVLESPVNVDTVVYKTLLPSLKKIATEERIDLREVSETLWTIGSTLCSKRLHEKCPLQEYCTTLISSKPYQRDGVFDPKDIGRFKK